MRQEPLEGFFLNNLHVYSFSIIGISFQKQWLKMSFSGQQQNTENGESIVMYPILKNGHAGNSLTPLLLLSGSLANPNIKALFMKP